LSMTDTRAPQTFAVSECESESGGTGLEQELEGLSFEEVIARVTQESLQDESKVVPLDEDLQRALELSALEHVTQPPLVTVDSDFDPAVLQAMEMSAHEHVTQPPLVSVDSDFDPAVLQAMAASLEEENLTMSPLVSTDSTDPLVLLAVGLSLEEAGNLRYQRKLKLMMDAAGHLPEGRRRQCLEVPKNMGGLIVGE
jgi:hypothetical protein